MVNNEEQVALNDLETIKLAIEAAKNSLRNVQQDTDKEIVKKSGIQKECARLEAEQKYREEEITILSAVLIDKKKVAESLQKEILANTTIRGDLLSEIENAKKQFAIDSQKVEYEKGILVKAKEEHQAERAQFDILAKDFWRKDEAVDLKVQKIKDFANLL